MGAYDKYIPPKPVTNCSTCRHWTPADELCTLKNKGTASVDSCGRWNEGYIKKTPTPTKGDVTKNPGMRTGVSNRCNKCRWYSINTRQCSYRNKKVDPLHTCEKYEHI